MRSLPVLNWLKKIHNDEEGLEAIQVVIILLIAFVAFLLIWRGYSVFQKDTYKTTQEKTFQIKPADAGVE